MIINCLAMPLGHRPVLTALAWLLCTAAWAQSSLTLDHDAADRLRSTRWPEAQEHLVYDAAGNLRQRVRVGRRIDGQPDNGHTYALITCGTWSACQTQARAMGGDLVTIRSQADNDWLLTTFGPKANNSVWPFWIGMNDLEAEGTWQWSSGEPLVFQNWAPGEPNDHLGVEDVAHVMADQQSRWNDSPDRADWGITQAVVEFSNARWDAAADYASHPHDGIWRYSRRLSTGELRRMDRFTAMCPSLPAGISCWTDAEDATTLPMVAIDTLGHTHRELTVQVPTRALLMHPGEDHDSAVLEFVAPQAGRYGITASFECIDVAPQGVGVQLRVNGDLQLDTILGGYRQAVGLSRSWLLEAGDVVLLEVSEGTSSYGNDSVAVRVQITPMQ